jgi:hypothetical protein
MPNYQIEKVSAASSIKKRDAITADKPQQCDRGYRQKNRGNGSEKWFFRREQEPSGLGRFY